MKKRRDVRSLYQPRETIRETYIVTICSRPDIGNSFTEHQPMNHEDHAHHEHCSTYTLYVNEQNRNQAVSNLVSALSEGCFCPFEIEILDIDQSPQLLQEEYIMSTPALVREWPAPRKMLCCDLSQCETVRAFLHESAH